MAGKKNNTLRNVLIGVGVLLVIAIAGNKLGWFGKGNIPEVSTDKVVKKEIVETVSASGKIQPEVEVKLSSEVSGEIVELLVQEGDIVKKGQLLCKVRPDVLQSGYDRAVASLNSQKASLGSMQQQLKQAEANFKNTEAKYKRSKELYKNKVLSAAEFDAAEAEYFAAKANLEGLRQSVIGSRYGVEQSAANVQEAGANLAKTTIYAPVAGVVSKLSVEKGDRVLGTVQMAGTELMRISNLTSMEVNVDVNESDINQVSINDQADIEVDAFQGKKFKGVVSEIASSSTVVGTSTDQVTNFTVKVRILPESYENLMKDGRSPFRPGLSATVDIKTNRTTGLAVPIQAVTTRDEKVAKPEEGAPGSGSEEKKPKVDESKLKEYVFVYQNGKAKQVEVKTGIQDDTNIQIISGLKEGDEVISRPFHIISKTLKDSMVVKKVDKDKIFASDKKD